MSDVFSITRIGLADGRQRLEALSVNAANASLPGFRRHVAVSRPFAVAGAGGGGPAATSPPVREGGGTGPAIAAHVDLRPGPPVVTGRPLDLAIEGDDLFFGLTDGERVWLTRAGSFRLGDDGALTGERGLRVLGVNGEIRLDSSDVEIASDGRVLSNGLAVAVLQLYRPGDAATLRAAGGSLLSAPGGFQPVEADAGRLRSGVIEGSNADGTQEMLDLITLSRQYESLVRVTQHYDDLLGRTIQKLGEF